MTQHERAKAWREARGLTVQQLADLTGYSPKTLFWFEKGVTPPLRNHKGGHPHDRTIKPWVWQRYRMACAGVELEIRNKRKFDWIDPLAAPLGDAGLR